MIPQIPSMTQAEARQYSARRLDNAEQLLPAFNILRLQADSGLRRPSKNINTRAGQLALLLEDSPVMRQMTEATDRMIRRRSILRRARLRAFHRAGDRSYEMPDVARALLRLAARSDWDRVDVVVTVVAKLGRGVPDDLSAHLEQTLARLAPALGNGGGARDYCCTAARSFAVLPPADLTTAAGRISSVVEAPDWAFDSPAPIRHPTQPKLPLPVAAHPTEAMPIATASLGDDRWAFIETSHVRVAGAFADPTLPALPSLDPVNIVAQFIRIGQLECVRRQSEPR